VGLRTQQPLVLDSRSPLCAGVRLVDERTRIRRLVSAWLQQPAGVRFVRRGWQHVGRLDGAAAAAFRRARRVREQCRARAATDSAREFRAPRRGAGSAARATCAGGLSANGCHGGGHPAQLEQHTFHLGRKPRWKCCERQHEPVGRRHAGSTWRRTRVDDVQPIESDTSDTPGSGGRRAVHSEHRSAAGGHPALSIRPIQHVDSRFDCGATRLRRIARDRASRDAWAESGMARDHSGCARCPTNTGATRNTNAAARQLGRRRTGANIVHHE